MTLASGTRFGNYEIQSALGAGGMGEVYRARDVRLGRDVAIKVLPSAFTIDPDRLARFEREARVQASLNDPNIAAIYGLEEIGGSPGVLDGARAGDATDAFSTYSSKRDGSRCLYALKLDPATGKPQSEPFLVAHFHDEARRWGTTGLGSAVTSHLFVASLFETASNIWMTTVGPANGR
jgi:serine/threonine protein kinase